MNRHTQALLNYKAKLYDRISASVSPELAEQIRNLKLDWYRFSNQVSDDGEAEVFIYDEIGGSFGVDANEFVKELSALDAKKITVRINSPGGSLFDSIAIHNALVQHKAKILTRVDALAASGASIVAMAGDEIEVMSGGQIMIHDALGVEMGNQRDMDAMARFLGIQSDNIADMYAAQAGGTREEWRARMQAETWMFGDEAVKMGLATRVYVKPKGEDDDEPEEKTEELPIENLITRKHSLANRGYKFEGRNAAPAPKLDGWDDVRSLVAAWK